MRYELSTLEPYPQSTCAKVWKYSKLNGKEDELKIYANTPAGKSLIFAMLSCQEEAGADQTDGNKS